MTNTRKRSSKIMPYAIGDGNKGNKKILKNNFQL